ncbi:DegQ family serine endoprotease [Devosia nitrariae]|nr:DegQ family serine endoprotease [Devosia nitrariae]
MIFFRKIVLTVAGVVVLGALASAAAGERAGGVAPLPQQAPVRIELAQAERQVPQSREQVQLSFAPVVRQVAPSVVNVYATRVEEQVVSPFANDPFFQRFFGERSPFFQSRPRESRSLGSGVIVDSTGLILTNSHVVSGATDIRIALADRREFAVDLVLDDPETDLAVLRIRDTGGVELPAIAFADSDVLEVGDLVLAIGNPFGVGQTVTSGIVSALARTGVEASDYEFFIQTDAAINPGNSGGALVDLDGRLVGINTAIYSRTGGSVGIGFAIPSNMAAVVAQAGLAGGEIVRPWLGAKTQVVSADIAESLQLASPTGAMITDVAPGGPAERAGLRPGDVVTAIDGVTVEDPSAFNFRLATKQLGSEARLAVMRGGQAFEATLPVEAPSQPEESQIARITGNTRFAGATGQELTPALAQEQDLPFDARGIVITEVEEGSPAEAMGLATGDIILSLNGIEMTDAGTFAETASRRVRTWEIVLQRDGRVVRTYVSG